jgi:hypothetical protein
MIGPWDNYDITPTGGKKTKLVSTVKHIDQTATTSSSGRKTVIIITICGKSVLKVF